MVYFDGHERRDVKVDRAEKLVMLQVLKEARIYTYIYTHSPTRPGPINATLLSFSIYLSR